MEPRPYPHKINRRVAEDLAEFAFGETAAIERVDRYYVLDTYLGRFRFRYLYVLGAFCCEVLDV